MGLPWALEMGNGLRSMYSKISMNKYYECKIVGFVLKSYQYGSKPRSPWHAPSMSAIWVGGILLDTRVVRCEGTRNTGTHLLRGRGG
jgi:hypothetical protein